MAESDREAALLAALVEGVLEAPLWATFLRRLREATGADFAALVFNPPGRQWKEAFYLLAADAENVRVQRAMDDAPTPVDALWHEQLPEGIPYSLEKLQEINDETNIAFVRQVVEQHGIETLLHMRVREATGVDAWLTIIGKAGAFSSETELLLKYIAPTLRASLQVYVAMERERYAASLSAEAVRRLQFGWITLDAGGRVLDCDEQGAAILSNSGVLKRSAVGKLAAEPRLVEKEIYQALARVAAAPLGRTRAITLCRDPWLDMLLVPARRKSISPGQTPAAIAYVHGDNWHSADRCEQLAELFGLAPRESRLALALSRGMNIAEAAEAFGLTVGTARIYSRSIYAKTGARGLPDLVRIILRSVLAISPDI